MTQVVDVDKTQDSIEQMLNDAETMQGVTIEVNEKINDQESRMPWVGVYRTGEKFPSRALGAGAGNRQDRLHMTLVIQESHPQTGRDCGRLLEKLKRNVLNILLSDESLKGNVDVLDDIEVVYTDYGLADSGAFTQQAFIHFVGVTRVRG